MFGKTSNRLISFLTAAVLTTSNVMPIAPVFAVDDEPDLTHQSIELYPNGEDAEQIVTLDGMMPEGAEAEAVDVSEDYEGIAAYNITIKDGRKEYQPGEENPIYVEITDPVISGLITLWHIDDDGNREQIFGSSAEDSKIGFYATGFSVYEIVKELDFDVPCTVVPVEGSTSDFDTYMINPVGAAESFTYDVVAKTYPELYGTATQIQTLDEFKAIIASGVYIKNTRENIYAKNSQSDVESGRPGITGTTVYNDANTNKNMFDAYNGGAVKYYFEAVAGETDSYYIYTYDTDGTTPKYVKHDGNKGLLVVDNDGNTTLTKWKISVDNGSFSFYTTASNKKYYWTGKAKGFAAYQTGSATYGETFSLWSYIPPSYETDPYQLNGKTYGLVNIISNNDNKNSALLAGSFTNKPNSLGRVDIPKVTDTETGKVSYTSPYGISGWTFEWVPGTVSYKLSALVQDGAERKYLKMDGANLYFVDAEEASAFTVVPNADGKIKLVSGSYAIQRYNDDRFYGGNNSEDANNYFDLVTIPDDPETDTLGLDGETFALVNKKNDTVGNAMMAQADAANASQLDNQWVQITESGYKFSGALSEWTFHWIDSNRYTISNGSKYLKIVKDNITLSDTPFILTVIAGSEDNYPGKIRIINTVDKYQVKRSGDTSFSLENNITNTGNERWFDLVTVPNAPTEDPFDLDGKTYGIMNKVNNTTAYSLTYNMRSAKQLYGKKADCVSGEQKYKSYGAPVGWTFYWQGYANYKISVDTGGGIIKWLKLNSSGTSLVDEADATVFNISVGTGDYNNKILLSPTLDNANSSIYRNNFGSEYFFQTGTPATPNGQYWHDLVKFSLNDPYKLDGKKYSLMHYVSGATGDALIAGETSNALQMTSTVARQKDINTNTTTSKVLYVAKNTDITEWTFQTAGEDWYYIYAEFGSLKKYINISESGVSVSETPQAIQVRPDETGRIMLSADGYSVKYLANTANPNEAGRFVSATGNGDYLYFVVPTEIDDQELVTYKANKVSVSEVKNGEQVIIYTRVWNGSGYDFCAIDHNGNLVPCYERGDSIMWLSQKINTMLWDFTEYYYEYTDTPNNYYELYNSYSGKYLAPKKSTDSVLSDTPVGINMEGRRYGEYYSTILAWDKQNYAYASLKTSVVGSVDGIDDTLIPGTRAKADTFYFARLVDITNDLTEIETVDNTAHGITMKMIDFDAYTKAQAQATVPDGGVIKDWGSATPSSFTWDYFAGNYVDTKGLLSTDLGADGYPKVNAQYYSNLTGNTLIENPKYDQSIAGAFADAQAVNHLFIQSTLEQSGYYEFDSCQNYATLKYGEDANGNTVFKQSEDESGKKLYLIMKDGKQVVAAYADDDTTKPSDAQPMYDFYVTKEIGTHDTSSRNSLKHGQFFPYDDIDGDTYANVNGQNLYSAEDTTNELPFDDPRKYERLHLIEDPDYFFGMQLDASFTQTPDGKDDWGHDIIFEFTGDDDFWLYVDGELVIDLGGIHSAQAGNVNFATGDVKVNGVTKKLRDIFYDNYIARNMSESAALEELGKHFDSLTENPTSKEDFETVFIDYTTHDMKIFYMERGASASNLHMRFNLNYVTPGDVILSKELTGSDDVDFELVEYPVQIWYCTEATPEGNPNLSKKYLLTQDNKNINVKYQNSTRNVLYAESYTPPGSTRSYDSVFFINPQQTVEIHFPEDTMFYQVIECGINTDVYDHVYVNGEMVTGVSVIEANSPLPPRQTFSSSWAKVEERKNIIITNNVSPDALRPLYFQKKLYDANYTPGMENADSHKITAEQDPTVFAFRLYLSNGVTDEMTLANMVKYRVISPNGKYCTWNQNTQQFDESNYTNGDENTAGSLKYALKQIADNDELEDKATAKENLLEPITFETSINGQISEIRAWYTVEVPNIPAGVTFELEERDTDTERPLGYDRVRYERVEGSYYTVDGAQENVGIVRASDTPQMNVINQRGYEVQAKKNWSDVDFALGHDDIYLALFIKTTNVDPETNNVTITYELAPEEVHPVRRLSTPNTEIRYFMQTLEHGKALSDYEIFEVNLTGSAISVDTNGYVTGYDRNTINGKIVIDKGFAAIYATDRAIADSTNGVVFGNDTAFLDTANEASWSKQLQFDSGVQLYGDEEGITAASVPAKLRGAEYLRTANASGSYNGDLCTFAAGAAAELYVAMDNRITPVPDWLNSWQKTADTILTSDNTTLELYKKNVLKGEAVTLGKNGGDGTTKNYVVLAAPIYSYQTEYQQGTVVNPVTINGTTYTARADKITNTRQGGIVINLYQMGTRDEEHYNFGEPLQGGVFTLKKGDERIGSYTSDADGKITILYSYEPGEEYTVIQESAPDNYIGLPEPFKFKVSDGDNPTITVTGNSFNWNNYHLPHIEGDQLVAYIDVYNKPFTLKAVKVDKNDSTIKLEGVHFALFRGVDSVAGLIPDVNPIEGYSDLQTNTYGVITGITSSLPDGTYFLRETQAAQGYKLYARPIRFTIRENDVVLFSETNGGVTTTITTTDEGKKITTVTLNTGVQLIKTDDTAGGEYECVLQIPNEMDRRDYYFDIEKIIFVDKNIHDSDTEQKFIFRIERFEEDTDFSTSPAPSPANVFYVTLNCDRQLTYTSDDSISYTEDSSEYHYSLYHEATDTNAPKYEFIESGVKINRTYGDGTTYTFPAAIWNGRKTVHVSSEGIYRISEVSGWSNTDYDFWTNSNRYKGYGDGSKGEAVITGGFRDSQTSGSSALPIDDKNCVYINVSEVNASKFKTAFTEIDGKTVYRPTASFTNTETEYAYLSSQSYADNTINRS